jgi:hypothetical protein
MQAERIAGRAIRAQNTRICPKRRRARPGIIQAHLPAPEGVPARSSRPPAAARRGRQVAANSGGRPRGSRPPHFLEHAHGVSQQGHLCSHDAIWAGFVYLGDGLVGGAGCSASVEFVFDPLKNGCSASPRSGRVSAECGQPGHRPQGGCPHPCGVGSPVIHTAITTTAPG